jgi:hypothetical protein
MPSSLSAHAAEMAESTRKATSSEVQKFARRFVIWRVMESLLSMAHALSHAVENRMSAGAGNMKCASALKSIADGYCCLFDTPRLSNRLCNGISNPEQATF